MSKQSLPLCGKKLTYIFLAFIILISAAVRFHKLGSFPSGFTWDEAAVGYNAYTIVNWGRDEWGKTLPLVFKSFKDDKNPVHIYLTVPFIKIFGLTEAATRASSAFFGVLGTAAIFFLASILFKSKGVGLIASLFWCISPFDIQFSRFNHELNFALFFFLAGTYFFYKALKDNNRLFWLAFLFWGIDLLTYQSAKVVTPFLVILLTALNLKTLLKSKKYFVFGAVIYLFFVGLNFIRPELLGEARLKQNSLGTPAVVWSRYWEYFGPKFLFASGDENPRHSIQTVGTFYWLDLPFLLIGFFGIVQRLFVRKDKQMLFLIAWMFLAPLPAAATNLTPHAPRAMFMLGSLTLVSAYGAYLLVKAFSNKYYQVLVSTLLVIASGLFLSKYLKDYFGKYDERYAIEWIYGMKDIVTTSEKREFNKVYMTDSMMQPYIFYLFYLKTPLPDFLATVKYNQTKSAPSNLVSSFGKYRFVWEQYHSVPDNGVLYAIRPSVYDGLFYKNSFNVVKLIKYPDRSDAFYLITAN